MSQQGFNDTWLAVPLGRLELGVVLALFVALGGLALDIVIVMSKVCPSSALAACMIATAEAWHQRRER